LWLFASAVHDAVSGRIVIAPFIVVPLIAVTAADEHRTALVEASPWC
jgi:hypothetical protein